MCRVDKFSLELDDLGQVEKVVVSLDDSIGSSPDWFLVKVTVEDITAKQLFEFTCNRWLSRNKDDGKTERELFVDTRRVNGNF